MSRKTKARIAIFIFCILVSLTASLGLSTFMYRTLEHLPMVGNYFFPTNIIGSIQQNQKHGLMFATMIFLFALLTVFVVISLKDKNLFASELDQITDKISTPKRVGENQYGESKWLDKRQCEKVFDKNELKMEGMYQYLVVQGRKDIQEIEMLKKEVLKEIKTLSENLADDVRQDEIYDVISSVIEKHLEQRDKVQQEKEKAHQKSTPTEAPNTAIAQSSKSATKPPMNGDQNASMQWQTTSKDTNIQRNNIAQSFRAIAKYVPHLPILKTSKQPEKKEDVLSSYIGKSFIHNAGLVVHYTKSKKKENIFCIKEDIHSIILGSTGSSKTRSVILQSICLLGLHGESIVINDPKGEIFQYTNVFLKRLGYEIIVIDFRERKLSQRYNFLQPVIQAVNDGDVDTAVDLAWDITSSLVGESQGERIWHNGECCVIVSAILCVVVDNKNRPEYQNLTNVYYFIANMCQPDDKGVMPLDLYLKTLDDKHPAKGIMAQIQVAPSRTRGSFLTSALATLKLFTNPNTFNMTCDSDFRLWDVGQKKTAIYMIIPDEKTTFYPLVSLFVYQLYVELADKSEKRGGRLNVRVNLQLDEFGNFAKIPAIENMLSVARGRGIRFNLVLQSYSQLNVKYEKELANVVKSNCLCKILLKTDEFETVKNISDDLGTYTTSSSSRSSSASSSQSSSNSNSVNLISRPLLTPDQVKKLDRPYALVMYSGHDPFMATLPDLSEWSLNTALGMGDEIHNMLLRMLRKKDRKAKPIREVVLWKIWEQFPTSANKTDAAAQQPKFDLQNHMDYVADSNYDSEDSDEIKTPEERFREAVEKEKNEVEKKNSRKEDVY